MAQVATASEKKNIFISHVHKDDALLPALKDLLARQDVEVRDGSINSSKPNQATSDEYIQREILAPRISWASTLVVLITHDTASSWWVNWEIEYAAKQGKRIVGVFAQGATNADIPPALTACGDARVVGWNSNSVASAVLEGNSIWEDPTGSPSEPSWELQRYRC